MQRSYDPLIVSVFTCSLTPIPISTHTHKQTLNLDGLNFLTDIGTLAILETCPHLKSLDLDGEMLTDKTAVFIGRTLISLEHLGISFCGHLTDNALMEFSGLCNLHSLRLRKGTNFTNGGFNSIDFEVDRIKARTM